MKKGIVRQVGYLQRLYRDSRLTEHKIQTAQLYLLSSAQCFSSLYHLQALLYKNLEKNK